MSALERHPWVELDRDASHLYLDYLADLAADAFYDRRAAEEDAWPFIVVEGACPICGRPTVDGDLCRPCDSPSFGPDAYGNER